MSLSSSIRKDGRRGQKGRFARVVADTDTKRRTGRREGGREEVVVVREELPLIDYEG